MKLLVVLISTVLAVCADSDTQEGRQARQFHGFAPVFHQATSHSHHSTPFATHATSQAHPVAPLVAHRAVPLPHHDTRFAHHAAPLAHHASFHDLHTDNLAHHDTRFALHAAPFAHHAASLAHHATPIAHHAAPFVHRAQPIVFHSAPLVRHHEPVFHAAPLPIAHHSTIHHTLPLPLSEPVASPAITAVEPVIAAKQAVLEPIPEPIALKLQPSYNAPSEPIQVIAPDTVVVQAKTPEARVFPTVILRNINHPPAETAAFDSDFETSNGIQQSSFGTVKIVDNTEVTVMEGSYSYIGADDVTYTVTWYADETGFHPSAPTGHFPVAVEPNHPEVAAAVRAQIAFAAEEDAAASRSVAYAAPVPRAPYPAYHA